MGLSLRRTGEEFGRQGLCVFFGWFCKARNDIVFRDEVLSMQNVKYLFAHLLWSETKLFLRMVLGLWCNTLIRWALVNRGRVED